MAGKEGSVPSCHRRRPQMAARSRLLLSGAKFWLADGLSGDWTQRPTMAARGHRTRALCDLGAFPGHGADRRGVDGARPFRQVTGAPVRRDPRRRAPRGSRRACARRGPGRAAGRPRGQPRALPDLRRRQLRGGRHPGPGPHPARVDGGAVRHRRGQRNPRRRAERPGRPRRGRLRQAGDDVDARLLQPRRHPRLAGRRRPRLGGRRRCSPRWPPSASSARSSTAPPAPGSSRASPAPGAPR